MAAETMNLPETDIQTRRALVRLRLVKFCGAAGNSGNVATGFTAG
jgi:hypothetical protein